MKRRYYALIFILLLATKGGAEMNDDFLYSTVLITHEVKSGSTLFGTGFLVFREIRLTEGHVFLITNKHVLPIKGANKK